jgi:DNA-binding transcriptional regulator YhcF (GntR family)
MTWKFTDDVPIYLQIINIMKADIVAGKYRSSDKLPAVRDLAMELGVNPNTVQKAFAELERQGLVQSERTSGRFVSIDEKGIEELRSDISDGYIAEMFANLRKLGMDDKMIKDAVKHWEDKQ